MIDEKLKSEQYYLNKVSMFMKGSYGITEQYSMLITFLSLIDDVVDDVLYFFDITNDDVFLAIEEMGNTSDILDKFAHLYGVRRNFTLVYDEAGTQHIQEVNLNNFELWMLIKAQILQNYYDGSYKQMREYYDKMNIPVYIITNVNSGQAQIILNTSPASITIGSKTYTFAENPNLELLFKANLLTIRSMGIHYATVIMSIDNLGIWDSTDSTRRWGANDQDTGDGTYEPAKWGL